jgi:O2-independent ubiquinone biosynthesis accessory factor UbiT
MSLPMPLDRTFLLPSLSTALRLIPDAMHTRLFSAMINHLLKGQTLADELGPLEGKRIRLSVADTGNEITFMVRGGRLNSYRCRAGGDWDVRIRGRLEDFWRLAARIEDPDTLFFHRHLDLEGETEAGLYLKNLLDAMEFDWEGHVRAVIGPRPGGMVIAAIHRAGLDRVADRLLHGSQSPARSRR